MSVINHDGVHQQAYRPTVFQRQKHTWLYSPYRRFHWPVCREKSMSEITTRQCNNLTRIARRGCAAATFRDKRWCASRRTDHSRVKSLASAQQSLPMPNTGPMSKAVDELGSAMESMAQLSWSANHSTNSRPGHCAVCALALPFAINNLFSFQLTKTFSLTVFFTFTWWFIYRLTFELVMVMCIIRHVHDFIYIYMKHFKSVSVPVSVNEYITVSIIINCEHRLIRVLGISLFHFYNCKTLNLLMSCSTVQLRPFVECETLESSCWTPLFHASMSGKTWKVTD